MIEKLPTSAPFGVQDDWRSKINELVDAVNTIQTEREAERFEIQAWIGIIEAVRKSVNKLETMAKNTNTVLESLVQENNFHEMQIDELQMKLEPEKCVTGTTADKLLDPTPSMLEEVLEKQRKEEERKILEALTSDLPDGDDAIQEVIHSDPYAEQRKWIGKLCRFWNFKDGAVDIGILKAVDNLKPTIPYINDIDCSYSFCEPVKPDDDIIYKGGDNE